VRASACLFLFLTLVLPGQHALALEPTTDDAVDWLRQYLEIDSSTPAGASRAGTLLRGILHRFGVKTKWIVSPTGQPFLFARAEGASPTAPVLMLLHHLDVVPAGSGWTRDPFAAEIVDGDLYGRGAVDDKSLGIAHLVAFLRYLQDDPAPTTLAFLAVGGEETGGAEGMGWLIDHHPELFEDVTAVLTEGGTNRVYGEHLGWWGIEVAQKRPLWLEATSEGRPGHGSMLNLHSAPHRLVRGLARVAERPVEFR
jgi:acetylornithine deacetylase/succinyl-diaminopimelate desuccinylase-like protein